jgi:dTDP-4-dehydrorhamnose 3,5-epimerase
MIEGVKVIKLEPHVDDRGYLIEIARRTGGDEPHAVIHKFGQVYLVGDVARGTVRAFHKHEVLWDWFFISHGSAKFILIDDRHNSPTYRDVMTIVTGERNPTLIAVPPGVYHGWMALEDDTQMVSTASEVYNREKPDEVRVSPEHFNELLGGNPWEVKGR